MQQAEDLFQFDFSLPVYENLTVSLVNVCHFLRNTSNYFALYRNYIFALCKHQGTTVCSYRKIVLQEMYVILAKFAPQGLENRKTLGSNLGYDFFLVYSPNTITSNNHAYKYSSDCSAQ